MIFPQIPGHKAEANKPEIGIRRRLCLRLVGELGEIDSDY
jgi:hypothetical protein